MFKYRKLPPDVLKHSISKPPNFKRSQLKLFHGWTDFGLTLNPMSEPKHSLIRVEFDSPAYKANLRTNDVLVEINKVNIRRLNNGEVQVLLQEATKNGQMDFLAIDYEGYLFYKKQNIRFSKIV